MIYHHIGFTWKCVVQGWQSASINTFYGSCPLPSLSALLAGMFNCLLAQMAHWPIAWEQLSQFRRCEDVFDDDSEVRRDYQYWQGSGFEWLWVLQTCVFGSPACRPACGFVSLRYFQHFFFISSSQMGLVSSAFCYFLTTALMIFWWPLCFHHSVPLDTDASSSSSLCAPCV